MLYKVDGYIKLLSSLSWGRVDEELEKLYSAWELLGVEVVSASTSAEPAIFLVHKQTGQERSSLRALFLARLWWWRNGPRWNSGARHDVIQTKLTKKRDINWRNRKWLHWKHGKWINKLNKFLIPLIHLEDLEATAWLRSRAPFPQSSVRLWSLIFLQTSPRASNMWDAKLTEATCFMEFCQGCWRSSGSWVRGEKSRRKA